MRSSLVEKKLRSDGHEVECVWLLRLRGVCARAALMFRNVE